MTPMDFRMRRFKRRTSIEVKPQQTMQPKAKQKQRRPSWRPRWEFRPKGPPASGRNQKNALYNAFFKPVGFFFGSQRKDIQQKFGFFSGFFGLLSSSSSTHTSADKRRGRALGKAPLPTKCNHWMSKTVSLFEVLIISTRKSEQNVKEMCLRVKFWLSILVWHILFCWLQDSLFIIGALFRRTKPRARNTFKVQILGNNDNWDWTFDTLDA